MRFANPLLTLLPLLFVFGCKADKQQELTDLARSMTGSYDNYAQAEADSLIPPLYLHMYPIWKDKYDNPWLYVEQGVSELPTRPYRQRFYEIKHIDGRLGYDTYYLKKSFDFNGRWRTPEYFDSIDASILQLREDCTVFVAASSEGHYSGTTSGKSCTSMRRDIKYLTRQVIIAPGEFQDWQRGFDALDQQIFGPAGGPYQFERQDTGAAHPDYALHQLADAMTGTFTSAAHAAKDSNYYDITLHMYPIWPGHPGTVWLYVEQALTALPGKPYRQRVYRLQQEADGKFSSTVYTLPREEFYIGKWNDPFYFNGITSENLQQRIGCTVYLEKMEDGSYIGSTHDKGCESILQGAAYATSDVEIQKDIIISWDRGWNEADEQVWGAEEGGYVFVRTDGE